MHDDRVRDWSNGVEQQRARFVVSSVPHCVHLIAPCGDLAVATVTFSSRIHTGNAGVIGVIVGSMTDAATAAVTRVTVDVENVTGIDNSVTGTMMALRVYSFLDPSPELSSLVGRNGAVGAWLAMMHRRRRGAVHPSRRACAGRCKLQ